MSSGILNVTKPVGVSSFTVVRAIGRLAGVHRVGHGGTLDPAADGVLPVLVNAATRLADFVHEWPKTYRATIAFGFTSDTGDREGVISPGGEAGSLTAAQIQATLPAFTGRIHQVPPMHSALKQGGEALYRKARRGETVERAARPVEVHALSLLDYDPRAAKARLEITSGKGLYVRSLAHDLGQRLGCGAYLQALTRIAYGPLHLADAVTTAELIGGDTPWGRWLLPMDLPLRDWPALQLDPADADAVSHGRAITASRASPGRYRLVDQDGRLLGWATVDASFQAQPRAVFSS
ncbi:MAG TPA: tRNA pseudouridine(55) synthase TruB [Candidatus Dormibacteraeota bacterium]|jgi:tRNA pseudouridine55 synthase